MIKKFLKKILPQKVILFYHKVLAVLAAVFYNFPSNKMIVIGVTGTKGKTATCIFISKILEEAGYKVGMTTTALFKIGEKEWLNSTKQTMQGRFELQRLLYQMVREKCEYAVIETSSEGIAQFRHLGINYDVAVFTSLSPEHIEAHGSFENYRKAKEKLFQKLAESKKKMIKGKIVEKIIVANLDDKYVNYFLKYPADKKYCYSINPQIHQSRECQEILIGRNIQSSLTGVKFDLKNFSFNLKVLGEFNVYNALAALAVADSQGIKIAEAKKALEKITFLPGRMEIINQGQDFTVIVDYAHEPKSLESVYRTILKIKKPTARIISLLGSQGGGRDKAKRAILGKLAGQYADYVIVTNEDPYDEDPWQIIKQVGEGVLSCQIKPKDEGKNFWQILDRKEAIKKALSLAQKDDIVILTGKGCEQCIVSKNNKKIPWDERKVVRDLIKEKMKGESK